MGSQLEQQLVSEFEGQLESELAFDEGMRAMPYRDSRGVLTIGMGHNLEISLPLGWEPPLTAAQEIQLLRTDILKAESALAIKLPWTVAMAEDARKGVPIDLAFNMGIGGLLEFHRMLAAIRDSSWATAAAELRGSSYYHQVPTRAERLAQQLITNRWAIAIDIA